MLDVLHYVLQDFLRTLDFLVPVVHHAPGVSHSAGVVVLEVRLDRVGGLSELFSPQRELLVGDDPVVHALAPPLRPVDVVARVRDPGLLVRRGLLDPRHALELLGRVYDIVHVPALEKDVPELRPLLRGRHSRIGSHLLDLLYRGNLAPRRQLVLGVDHPLEDLRLLVGGEYLLLHQGPVRLQRRVLLHQRIQISYSPLVLILNFLEGVG